MAEAVRRSLELLLTQYRTPELGDEAWVMPRVDAGALLAAPEDWRELANERT